MTLLKKLRKSQRLSERELSQQLDISRETLRHVERDFGASNLSTIQRVASAFSHQVLLEIVPTTPCLSDCSTVAISMHIVNDGFDSWKIHLMNFVDEFRRSSDMRLVLLPPVQNLDRRLTALLAATVSALCFELELVAPEWAATEYFLSKPWFVSGIESLKASSIQESPYFFRRNNIFVLDNFLKRA